MIDKKINSIYCKSFVYKKLINKHIDELEIRKGNLYKQIENQLEEIYIDNLF